eukprot:XP_002527649.2 zinc finger CCCH domain-containing protein 38 [Ricinus communis]
MRKSDLAYGKMSGSGRRRSSKWDLKEESRILFDSTHEKGWSGKAGLSFHDKESQRGWLSPETAGGNRPKWSVLEPLSGRRGSRRDDSIDEDHNRSLKAMTAWEGEENYGTRMSPGLDEWRHQSRRNSPRNEWKRSRRSRSRSQSRSRSRSPDRGFGREPGLYDRSRSRSAVSSQICKDFAAGRCRRGNHCQFLHQGTQTYEDDWERHRKTATSQYPIPHDSREYPTGSGRSTDSCSDFLKGNCRRGASCRFAHHGATHAAGKGSSNEVTRERNSDRRHRDASPERHGDREIRRPADVPCKFFAAGNCRNGKYCRFSHQGQALLSPERSRDGRFSHDQNADDIEKVWNGPKWSSTSTTDAVKLNEDKNGTVGELDHRATARSVDDRWGHCLEEDKTLRESLIDHKMPESDKKETLLWKTENAGDKILGSEQRAGENWLGDMDMSPEWNYKVQPSNHIDKQECVSLTSCDPIITQEASGQVHNATAVMPSIINEASTKPPEYSSRDVSTSALPHDDKNLTGKAASSHGGIFSNMVSAPSFNQNSLNSSAVPLPGINMGGQGQVTILTSGGRGFINPQSQTLFQEGNTLNRPDVGEANVSQVNPGVPITQNMVSSEQLTQLTSISASLAQLLANGQQLPQLYAAHTSHAHNSTETPSFANSEGPVKANSAVTIQLNETVGKQKQCDPLSDGIEPEKHDLNVNDPSGLSPDVIGQKNFINGKLEMSSKSVPPSSLAGAPKTGDYNKFCSLEEPNNKGYHLNQLEPGAVSKETKENNRVVTEESGKVEDKAVQENDLLENVDGDGKIDEGKKGKDVKGIRAFKFALVEFVKDLLKPAWKEGQMSKDAYKNIVKKVVDKVTGTMQGASIPQTQEKIQQYLSFSKPKLTKLVQAYVEKLQKDK